MRTGAAKYKLGPGPSNTNWGRGPGPGNTNTHEEDTILLLPVMALSYLIALLGFYQNPENHDGSRRGLNFGYNAYQQMFIRTFISEIKLQTADFKITENIFV